MRIVTWTTPPEQPPGNGASPQEVAAYFEGHVYAEVLWEMARDQQLDLLVRLCDCNGWSWQQVAGHLAKGPLAELAVHTTDIGANPILTVSDAPSVTGHQTASSEAIEDSEQTLDGWTRPLPLGFNSQLPPFPLESLPPWLRSFVVAVAEFTQTPPDLVAVIVLAVLSTILAKRYVVRVRNQWVEPVNLYLVVALASGERKSAVVRLAIAPVQKLEAKMQAEVAIPSREAEARSKAAQAEAKKAQKAAEDAPEDRREELLQEAVDAKARAEEITVPTRPRLLADDITQEALTSLLEEQDGKVSILSAEGGVFEILAGRYTDGQPNIDIFLKGHSGDAVLVDRKGRPPERVDDPAITLGLTVQPEVVKGLARNRGFRGRGLLARIWFSLPSSRVGARKIEPEEIPDLVLLEYETNMLAMGQKKSKWELDEPVVLVLDDAAQRRLLAFQKELEPRLAPTGQLGHIADWGGKLVGGAVRIAALLHVASNPSSIPSTEISSDTMAAALEIAEYFIPHALAAFDLMGTDQVIDDARRALAWLRDEQVEKFSARDAFQVLKGTFKKMGRLNEALRVLLDHHYLAPAPSKKSGPGRPQSPAYWVSPWVRRS